MGFFSSGVCSQTSSRASSTRRNVLEIGSSLTQNSRSGEQQVPGKAMVTPHPHTACKGKTEAQNCHGSHTLSHSQSRRREGVGASGFCSAVWEAKCDLGGECVPVCVPGYMRSHTAGLGKAAQGALWEEPKPVPPNYIVPRLTRGSLKP